MIRKVPCGADSDETTIRTMQKASSEATRIPSTKNSDRRASYEACETLHDRHDRPKKRRTVVTALASRFPKKTNRHAFKPDNKAAGPALRDGRHQQERKANHEQEDIQDTHEHDRPERAPHAGRAPRLKGKHPPTFPPRGTAPRHTAQSQASAPSSVMDDGAISHRPGATMGADPTQQTQQTRRTTS